MASTFPAAMGGRRRYQAIFGHGCRVAICLTVRVSMDYYALKREKRPAFGLTQCLHFRQRRAPESKKRKSRLMLPDSGKYRQRL